MRRNSMMDERERLIDEATVWVRALYAEAEVGFLAPDWARAEAADAVLEAAELGEQLAPKGHARSDQVADGRTLARQAAVRTADDPPELGRKPMRPLLPDRLDCATNSEHALVLVLAREQPQPVGGS